MTITRKQFESGDFKKRVHTSRMNHPIAKLLMKSHSLAFKAEEIAKRVKMGEDTVRSMLANLKKDNLVVHKSPYFAWKKNLKKHKKK